MKHFSRANDCQQTKTTSRSLKKQKEHQYFYYNFNWYCQRFFQEHKQNIVKTWEGVETILNIRNNAKKNINSLNITDIEETNPAILSNSFTVISFSQQ